MENETQSIVIRPVAEAVAIRLEEIGAKAAELVENSKAENTRKAYRSDWTHFEAWCQKHQRHSLPAKPETVAFYLADLSRLHKVSTLSRRVATISEAHKAAGFESPTKSSQVRFVFAGIKREKGVAQAHMKPCLTRHLQGMIDHLPDSIMGCRDRALLLLGFAGAMRRSELVGLDVCDLTFSAEGMVVAIRRSKTDQAGVGRSIGIPFGQKRETCPVRAVQNWLEAAQIEEGPLFRAVSRAKVIRQIWVSGSLAVHGKLLAANGT